MFNKNFVYIKKKQKSNFLDYFKQYSKSYINTLIKFLCVFIYTYKFNYLYINLSRQFLVTNQSNYNLIHDYLDNQFKTFLKDF